MAYTTLFIDDERFPAVSDGVFIARSSNEATDFIKEHGIPIHISFDHDLGGDDTSMKFCHWLCDLMLLTGLKFPKGFTFYVHSQNPVGRENIKFLMNGIINEIGYEE